MCVAYQSFVRPAVFWLSIGLMSNVFFMFLIQYRQTQLETVLCERNGMGNIKIVFFLLQEPRDYTERVHQNQILQTNVGGLLKM
jgi:hypothetical protein